MTRRPTLRRGAVGAATGTLALAGLAASPAHAADATVTVVHGVALPAAATVDVWAGDQVLLDDFAYGDLQTVTVPEGTYDLYVTPADASDTSSALISAEGVEVPGGANASVVANQAGGSPNLAVFVNDTAPAEPGNARVTARHTADAPAVDVLVDGQSAFTGLEPAGEQSAQLPAGSYDVSVQAGGQAVPGLSAEGLALEAGTGYYAYAVGDGENGYQLLLQTVDLGGMPSQVPAGDGSSAGLPYLPLLLLGAGAAVVAVSARRVAAARR